MATSKENESLVEKLTIQTGTLYSVGGHKNRDGSQRVYVVLNTGEDNYFSAAPLYRSPSGLSFFHVGSAYAEMIESIIGCLSPEEFLAAAELGSMIFSETPLSDSYRNYLMQSLNAGSRMLVKG